MNIVKKIIIQKVGYFSKRSILLNLGEKEFSRSKMS